MINDKIKRQPAKLKTYELTSSANDKEKQEFAKEHNENNCDFMRLYLEKVILFITNIRKNQELWLKLIEYAKSIN